MTTFTREDFEMAAKAAGIHRNRWDYEYCRNLGHMVTPSMMWNPPDNDGEALRLAVALGLQLTIGRVRILVSKLGIVDIEELPGDDPCAVTRHAIFRAAIAIGRAMPAPEQRPKADDCSASPGVAVPEQQTASLYHPNWIAKP